MKNSFLKGAECAAILSALVLSIAGAAQGESYYRVNEQGRTPAPMPQNNGYNVAYGLNGQEIVPYAYGYSYSLPDDGNWRFIEARCFNGAKGETCIDAHWIRKQKAKCEEVTSHTIRTGNYVRIVPAGAVSTCRK